MPIDAAQPRHAGQFAHIARYQPCAMAQDGGGDQQVVRADGCYSSVQHDADLHRLLGTKSVDTGCACPDAI